MTDKRLTAKEVRALSLDLRQMSDEALGDLLALFSGQRLVQHVSIVKQEQRARAQRALPLTTGDSLFESEV
jgi:hypothetical protein